MNAPRRADRPHQPPRTAEWLLRRLFADSGDFTHLGDFAETFDARAAEKGSRRARLWYWAQVFRSLPGFAANRLYWSLSMLRNYAVITYRTIMKNAGYSLISLLGLAVGLAAFILILAYVRFETGYDRFHEKGDRIFRLLHADVKTGEKPGEFETWTPDPLATLLKTEFPEVRHAARVMRQFNDPAILSYEDRSFAQSGLYADQDFLEIFSFPFVRGDRSSALAAPGSIVITEEVARKLYGDEDPVGKPLSYGVRHAKGDLTVTGVVRNVPADSHLQFDYLLSVATLESDKSNDYMFRNWNVWNFTIYTELAEPSMRAPLEDKIAAWVAANKPENTGEGLRFFFQPLYNIHLRSNIKGQLATNNEIRTVSLFLAIAVLILLIAAVNYMNLVTARASTRAREIGVRKVTGADRGQLTRQFIGESVLFAFLALVAALALARLALGRFNAVAGTGLGFSDLVDPSFFLMVTVSTLVIGLLSGAYPAFLLSSFQASAVLKEHAATGRKSSRFRDALVVGQFAASVSLLICALVVSGQLRFIQNQKLGYDREHVVIIPLREPGTLSKASTIKIELLGHPEVDSVSITTGLPTNIRSRMINTKVTSDQGEKNVTDVCFDYVDADFLEVFRIPLVAGRNFSQVPGANKGAILINESMMRKAGWTESVGKEVALWGTQRLIGVVKDFRFKSFHHRIEPMVLMASEGDKMAVRLNAGNVSSSIALLKDVFERNTRSQPFDFSFLDDEYDALYRKERRAGEIFGAFAALAVFIACLGLLGLAAFAVERRTKEIGIRKVLGASAPRLAARLSREFVGLVLLANVIAWPVAYYAMSRWLQSFAYRIGLGPGVFVLAALGVLFVAVLTVATQTLRAASANPVESLRYE